MMILRVPAPARAVALGSLAAIVLACTAPSCAAQESMTLRKIKETRLISVGYRDGSIPFSYLDGRQNPVGYSMDICGQVVEAIKRRLNLDDLQVQLTPVTSATRIPLVANNTVDLECGTTTNTLEREKHVAFSVTTFVAMSRLASRRSSNIAHLDDLRGKTVVSTAGTTSIAKLLELNTADGRNMNIIAGKDHAQSFHLMETGRAVAFAMDDVLLYGMVATASDPSQFVVSGEPLSVEPYAVGLPKGDPEFKKLVDDTIIELFRSGKIMTLYRKWFDAPIPPRGIVLKLPMSGVLKRIIEHPTDSGDPAAYQGG